MRAESWLKLSLDPGDGGLELLEEAGDPGYDLKWEDNYYKDSPVRLKVESRNQISNNSYAECPRSFLPTLENIPNVVRFYQHSKTFQMCSKKSKKHIFMR